MFRSIDLFAGIGGIRLGFDNAFKNNIKTVFASEWDKYAPICGFSIKSDLGSPPTLLNASKATNFVFEVKNLSNQHINEINAINTKNKILDRMAAIYNYDGCLQFENVKTVFEDNLIMIDSRMPEILAAMLLYSYRTGCVDSEDIIDYL